MSHYTAAKSPRAPSRPTKNSSQNLEDELHKIQNKTYKNSQEAERDLHAVLNEIKKDEAHAHLLNDEVDVSSIDFQLQPPAQSCSSVSRPSVLPEVHKAKPSERPKTASNKKPPKPLVAEIKSTSYERQFEAKRSTGANLPPIERPTGNVKWNFCDSVEPSTSKAALRRLTGPLKNTANSGDKNRKSQPWNFLKKFLDEDQDSTVRITYMKPRWPQDLSLYKIIERLTNITALVLDDSQLDSLRDISSGLPSLVRLSAKNCGLQSLDGAFAFRNLQHLNVSENSITHLVQCSYMPELETLEASENMIDSLDGFTFLSCLQHFRSMTIYGNPVTHRPGFYQQIKAKIPSLRDLYPRIAMDESMTVIESVQDEGYSDDDSSIDDQEDLQLQFSQTGENHIAKSQLWKVHDRETSISIVNRMLTTSDSMNEDNIPTEDVKEEFDSTAVFGNSGAGDFI